MAHCIFVGDGVEKDLDKAVYWLGEEHKNDGTPAWKESALGFSLLYFEKKDKEQAISRLKQVYESSPNMITHWLDSFSKDNESIQWLKLLFDQHVANQIDEKQASETIETIAGWIALISLMYGVYKIFF